MNQRLIAGLIFLFVILLTCPLFANNENTTKPTNFVVFLVDDLGWTDVGCFGSGFYKTPNIDQFAKTGVKLTNAYATCQVCSPTRASMLTGKYPQRVGITDFISPSGGNQPERWRRKTAMLPASYQDHLALEELTIAEKLKKRGYATFFAGKWHLGSEGFFPEDQGFDVNQGGIDRGGPYGGKKYFSPYGNPRLTDGPDGEHLPDRLATETAKFIKEHRNEPFLAYLSFYSVHTPLMGRPDLVEDYKDLKTRIRLAGPIWGKEGKNKYRLVQEHAVYAAMVTAMDQAVGKVLNSLEENGLTENTVVLFTSDNGGLATSEGHPTTNRPLRAGKGWIYEGGIRVPTIMRAPGVTDAGTECHTPVCSVDYFPTFLELASAPADQRPDMDGMSLVPMLKGDTPEDRPIFWHYPHYGNQGGSPSAAVRLGNMKLIQWLETDTYSLYDLAADIGETQDLIQTKPQVAEKLKSLLKAWQKDVGAKPLQERSE